MTNVNSSELAILAPVPDIHLESACVVAAKSGFVAFGSRCYDQFLRIDELREGQELPVLIYPSQENESETCHFEIKWIGRYRGWVAAQPDGTHPDGMMHRPPTTEGEEKHDPANPWLLFWHVADLQPLVSSRRISEIQKHKKGTWRKDAPARRPEIVACPEWLP